MPSGSNYKFRDFMLISPGPALLFRPGHWLGWTVYQIKPINDWLGHCQDLVLQQITMLTLGFNHQRP